MSPTLLGHPNQAAIGLLQLLCRLLPFAPRYPMQLLGQPAHAPHPGPEDLLAQACPRSQHRLRPPQEAAEHPHPVRQEATVRGMVHGRLHHRAVQSELPSAGDPQLPGQLDHPLVNLLQRPRTNQVGPAVQGGIVRHRLQVDPAELAQDQAVTDEVLGVFITPAVHTLDHQHPQDHLDRRAMPAQGQTVRVALDQIRFDSLEERVIVQQVVEFAQLRLKVGIELGDEGEEVDGFMAIHDHDDKASQGATMGVQIHHKPSRRPYFAPKTSTRPRKRSWEPAVESESHQRPSPATRV